MTLWPTPSAGTLLLPLGISFQANPGLVWLHALSDGLLAVVYLSIPVSLLFFMRKRRDVPYRSFLLFLGAFILASGVMHALEVWAVWHAHYALSGSVKAVTAAISAVTTLMLLRALPEALTLPSAKSLHAMNQMLEARVSERTVELADANERLRREVAQREIAESEVRRLNSDLQNRISQLQTLFEVLPVGVGIAPDATCRKIQTNPAFAQMLGLKRDANASLSAGGHDAPSGFHVEKDGRILTPDELPIQTAVRENRTLIAFEETVVRADGTRLELLANAVPLHDEAGAVNGCIATFQDITGQKRSEERRRQLDRQLLETQKLESLGVLAGGIAHDFNNLLTGVLGNASLARMDLPADSPLEPILEGIETAARRAAELCRQMLAYSGRGRFVIEVIDINSIVEETAELLSVSINKNCSLRFELSRSLPHVKVDATQVRQIIMNLVINASEAITGPGGLITVSTGLIQAGRDYVAGLRPIVEIPPGQYVFLEVTDNGGGMDSATIQKIFDPFFTTKFTGRGLGLAAVLGIIRSHKGSIKVYSEIGRGTTFKILLPSTEEVGAASASGSSPLRSVALQGGGKVLVVDDEAAVRSTAERLLRRIGYDVVLACDGIEALDNISSDGSDIAFILLDLTMPRMDGEETFRRLRVLNPDVKVILMSGFNHQEATSRFAGKGLAGFVQKPFEAESLAAAIERVTIR